MNNCLPVTPPSGIPRRFPTLHRLWLLHVLDSDQWLHRQTVTCWTYVCSIVRMWNIPQQLSRGQVTPTITTLRYVGVLQMAPA